VFGSSPLLDGTPGVGQSYVHFYRVDKTEIYVALWISVDRSLSERAHSQAVIPVYPAIIKFFFSMRLPGPQFQPIGGHLF
jgi:hypothetical protein